MTLKKYNIIIYFIILLNFVVNVVIAQESTLESPSPTITIQSTSTTTLPTPTKGTENTEKSVESCSKNAACTSANNTLRLCNGLLETPNKYIEKNIRSGVYKPEDRGLAKCMCNQPYYDMLSNCIECFVEATETKFEVSPIEEYKEKCKEVGTEFTQTIPPITSGISPKIKWSLLGGIALVVIGLIAFAVFKCYKNKKVTEKHKVSAEGGNLSTSNDKYPPPQSPSVQYRYQYGEYNPPSDTYYPPPPGQDGQYPPPPPQQHGAQGGQGGQYPPPPQHEGGQGGQSDSYYAGSF